MTEYEIATLGMRETGLWIAAAHVVATLIIGTAQVGIVWHGIRAMQRMGSQRAREQDQRHAESMRALETLIERTART